MAKVPSKIIDQILSGKSDIDLPKHSPIGQLSFSLYWKNLEFYPDNDLINRKQYRPILTSNLLVNLVTYVELECKRIIRGNNNWNEPGLKELLKEKITLSDAYGAFVEKGITREYLISEFNSFQNLSGIKNVFEKLTGIDDFWNHFGNSEARKTPKESFNTVFPNWKNDLEILFVKRHDFIHEGKTVSPEDLDVGELWVTTMFFCAHLTKYMSLKFN